MRYEVITRTAEGYTVVRDVVKGENRIWICGFTYRDWVCAATRVKIARGDFAYRLMSPRNIAESRLRITAKVLDPL